MSTAAIAIDNFLDVDKWNNIQSGISEYLNSHQYSENRTSLHTQINSWIKEKLMSLNLWQYAWEDDIKLFSSLNVLPKNLNVESADSANGGYHREQGGYIYYIHPTWESSWGGNLKFKNCNPDKIEPKSNRFVWVNPNVWHGIEVVNNLSNINRITVVAWPAGSIEYDSADIIINNL